MTVYNNTATTLAPYNDTLNISTEEKHQLIRIDRKRRAEAQKRKNRILNMFLGLSLSMLSLAASAIDYLVFNELEGACVFAIPFLLGLFASLQDEKIFDF